MFVVDVDLLVYAVHKRLPQHDAAAGWLEPALGGHSQTVALPWRSVLGFVRLVSNPRLFADAITVSAAWAQAERWLDARAAWVPAPGPRHRHLLAQLIEATRPASRGIAGLHLAALAMENGLTVVSADVGFDQMPGVRRVNPLRPAAAT